MKSGMSLALCVVALLLAPSRLLAQDQRPPNVVLILADDLGWGDVGFNGRTQWQTPNIDRLAAQGTVFRRWYTAGVTCAPSRASLMTGRYPIHCGVSANNQDLPASEVTIAEALKQRGYVTGMFGKWHHGRPRGGAKTYVHPMDHGFDEFFGFDDATEAHQQYPRELWFNREKKPVEGYANILFTDHALDFLKRQKDKPFFLYLPYTISHFRIEAPDEDVAPFKGRFKEKKPDEPLNATYAAMVTRLDKEVGRVLAALDELGLSRNTLVVFTSDHGATFEAGNKGTSAYHKSNGPFRGQKRTLWEGGVRVPAAVRWPGQVPEGKTSHEVVHMTDFLPTVLAAVGAQPEAEWKVDGLNVLDVWRGKVKSPPRTLFWEWRAEGYNQLAAMRGNLKLVVSGNTAPELYDVVNDPGEMRSVHAEHAKLVKQLQDELKAWIATEGEASKDRGRGRQEE
jgi:arylsulfatase A-like enzyme